MILALLISESNSYHFELINVSFLMLTKLNVVHHCLFLKSYLSHQYQIMIECAATVICLIQKKLKSQTKNQFEKKTG